MPQPAPGPVPGECTPTPAHVAHRAAASPPLRGTSPSHTRPQCWYSTSELQHPWLKAGWTLPAWASWQVPELPSPGGLHLPQNKATLPAGPHLAHWGRVSEYIPKTQQQGPLLLEETPEQRLQNWPYLVSAEEWARLGIAHLAHGVLQVRVDLNLQENQAVGMEQPQADCPLPGYPKSIPSSTPGAGRAGAPLPSAGAGTWGRLHEHWCSLQYHPSHRPLPGLPHQPHSPSW